MLFNHYLLFNLFWFQNFIFSSLSIYTLWHFSVSFIAHIETIMNFLFRLPHSKRFVAHYWSIYVVQRHLAPATGNRELSSLLWAFCKIFIHTLQVLFKTVRINYRLWFVHTYFVFEVHLFFSLHLLADCSGSWSYAVRSHCKSVWIYFLIYLSCVLNLLYLFWILTLFQFGNEKFSWH